VVTVVSAGIICSRGANQNQVGYVIGLAKNKCLNKILEKELNEAKQLFEQTKKPSRVFKDFRYETQESWSCKRRVVGKAEQLEDKANPRFVVTSLSAEEFSAQTVYEVEYCGRGDMENRIKEQQRFLFADRTSCHTLRANQLRLAFSTVAYVLLRALREFGLKGTPLENAQADTIRLRLLKIGAVIRVTVRKCGLRSQRHTPGRKHLLASTTKLNRMAAPRGGAEHGISRNFCD